MVGFLLEKQLKGGKSNLKFFFDDDDNDDDDDDDDEDDDGIKVCWTYVFSWEKFKQQSSRGKTSEICNSMASFTAHCKKPLLWQEFLNASLSLIWR